MNSGFMKKVSGLATTLLDESKENFEKLLGVMDEVFLALALVIVGFVVGNWARRLIIRIGQKLKVHHFSDKIGFSHLLRKANIKTHPAQIIGKFTQGYIITIFLIGASKMLEFDQITDFLDSVILYIPNILIALVILLLGMRIANTAGAILVGTLQIAHSRAAQMLSLSARYIIITFSIMAALFQLKIAADLMRILFTGFIAMIALAGGLAFGLGGKHVVREFLEDIKKVSPKYPQKSQKK